MRAVLIALALLAAAPAQAGDCTQYAEALAYNACLAAKGPKARAVPVGQIPASRARSHRVIARRGRSSMVFSVAK